MPHYASFCQNGQNHRGLLHMPVCNKFLCKHAVVITYIWIGVIAKIIGENSAFGTVDFSANFSPMIKHTASGLVGIQEIGDPD
jgi:hypothetical protein